MTETNLINSAQLAKKLGVSKSRLSQILRKLREGGQDLGQPFGQMILFDPDEVATVMSVKRRKYEKDSSKNFLM